MSIYLKEFEAIEAAIIQYSSLNDRTLNNSIESLLRRSLGTSVISVCQSDFLLGFRIDLKKELDTIYRECMIFIVRRSKNEITTKLDLIVENIFNSVSIEGMTDQPSMIFTFGMSKNDIRLIKSELFGNCILDSEVLKGIICSSLPLKEILYNLKSISISDINICPYKYLGPCSPKMFFGRVKMIREILLGKQPAFAIVGGRRIGKTSLLYKLRSMTKKELFSHKNYHPLHIDCTNISSFDFLALDIAKKLFPHYFYGDENIYHLPFQDIVKRVKGLWKQPLLLFLDEIDPLVERDKYTKKQFREFFNTIRSLVYNNQVKLVVTGHHFLMEAFYDQKHPFHNLCEQIFLGVLNHDEVNDLICIPLSWSKIKLESENKIVDKIYDFTNGHPSVIQFIAKSLYQGIETNVIRMDDLMKVIKSYELKEFIIDDFLANTSKLERLICLFAIHESEFDRNYLIEMFSKYQLMINSFDTKFHFALKNLKFCNILVVKKDNYRFLYPILQSTIKDYYYSEFIIESLSREIKNGR